MKLNVTLLAILFITLGVAAGCKKGGYGMAYSMKATIGTNTYEAPNCLARPSGSSMLIYGVNTTATNITKPSIPYISITIANWHETLDSFYFDSTLGNHIAQYIPAAGQVLTAKSGLIKFNTINQDNMSGVFQFVCADGTKVSEGQFTARRLQ